MSSQAPAFTSSTVAGPSVVWILMLWCNLEKEVLVWLTVLDHRPVLQGSQGGRNLKQLVTSAKSRET